MEPEYISNFIKAVYPDKTELCRIASNEKIVITDATEMINEQRQRIAELESELEEAKRLLLESARALEESEQLERHNEQLRSELKESDDRAMISAKICAELEQQNKTAVEKCKELIAEALKMRSINELDDMQRGYIDGQHDTADEILLILKGE